MGARTDTMQCGHFTSGKFGDATKERGLTIGLERMRGVTKHSPNTKRMTNEERTMSNGERVPDFQDGYKTAKKEMAERITEFEAKRIEWYCPNCYSCLENWQVDAQDMHRKCPQTSTGKCIALDGVYIKYATFDDLLKEIAP